MLPEVFTAFGNAHFLEGNLLVANGRWEEGADFIEEAAVFYNDGLEQAEDLGID